MKPSLMLCFFKKASLCSVLISWMLLETTIGSIQMLEQEKATPTPWTRHLMSTSLKVVNMAQVF